MDDLTLEFSGTSHVGHDCPKCHIHIEDGIHFCGKEGERIILFAHENLRTALLVGGKITINWSGTPITLTGSLQEREGVD